MKSVIHGLWVSAAISFALTVGCGELPNNNTSCTSDSSCSSGEMCHPILKKCIPSCTGSGDCPSSAKTCATITGQAFDADAGVSAFCQCATDALCNGGSSGTLVCMTATKTCETKCASSSDCPTGYTCDTATGQCSGGGGQDGGTSCAGTDWDSCGTGQVCNFTTNFCATPGACSTANAQPDTCGFGGFCASGTCSQVHKPTCANFTPPGGKTPVFDPRTTASPAPIIYKYDDLSADDTGFCPSGTNAFSVMLYAYRTDADWPAVLSAVPGFFYVKTDGSETSATSQIRPMSGYTPNGRAATFKATFCSQTITSNLQVGFYFTNGNEFCAIAAQGTAVP